MWPAPLRILYTLSNPGAAWSRSNLGRAAGALRLPRWSARRRVIAGLAQLGQLDEARATGRRALERAMLAQIPVAKMPTLLRYLYRNWRCRSSKLRHAMPVSCPVVGYLEAILAE